MARDTGPSSADDKASAGNGGFDLEGFRQVPEEAGLSLDQLSAALAGMLGAGDDPYAAAATATDAQGQPDLAGDASPDDGAADLACEITPRSILEAMLFVGSPKNEPLGSRQVAGLMRGVRPAEIDALVCDMNQDYQRRNCPYRIVSDGAGYRLQLAEKYAPLREKFYGRTRQARLSQASIEVLAAVAYHAPISADEVSRLRGTPSGALLSQLVRRQLLRLERTDTKPRQVVYHTTTRFLALFGLQSLAELPHSHDLEEAVVSPPASTPPTA